MHLRRHLILVIIVACFSSYIRAEDQKVKVDIYQVFDVALGQKDGGYVFPIQLRIENKSKEDAWILFPVDLDFPIHTEKFVTGAPYNFESFFFPFFHDPDQKFGGNGELTQLRVLGKDRKNSFVGILLRPKAIIDHLHFKIRAKNTTPNAIRIILAEKILINGNENICDWAPVTLFNDGYIKVTKAMVNQQLYAGNMQPLKPGLDVEQFKSKKVKFIEVVNPEEIFVKISATGATKKEKREER